MGRKLTEEEKNIIKKYGHLFRNTGGNDIAQFIEREDINPFSNIIAFVMQSDLICQMQLIQCLIKEGFLAA